MTQSNIQNMSSSAILYDSPDPEEPRLGDWMQTFSGRQFWPMDPRPEEIFIEDIATAESNLCRFGGHCLKFYSVAEHSWHVSHLVPPPLALCGLLHDGTEGYVLDMPKPLKNFLPDYQAVEHKVWLAVAERFGLPKKMPPEIKHADISMLLLEAREIMAKPAVTWKDWGVQPAEREIYCWSPEQAKAKFLERYNELTALAA